ncbi:alpha/beta hydrolase [Amycolatopsis pithecellobii]|uniref:Alpha/beta hydrolase n=1 Tax=Amycolatopsis pithecellobii TaxID=664692 RepID=A0A6N7YP42_9PSEU|nr:alpha/beta hydrolase [Amycolatopsis pithecellobii]MTD53648.1 alpha/beta hydrolase [Amycolatopsis pithecellobii]
MVVLSDVTRWNPGVLNDIATLVRQREQVLIHSGDDFAKVIPVEGWSGPAADNAISAHRGFIAGIGRLAAGASAVGQALAQASDAIAPVQQAILNAEELARKYGYQVTDTGAVLDTFWGQAPPDLHPDDRARARQQVVDDLAQALRTAEDIDNDLTAILQRAGRGEFGTGNDTTVTAAAAITDPGLTPLAPPPDGAPSQNAAWWATLSKTEQDGLLRDHPDWLGNFDGLPGAVRSQANLARLPAERALLEQQRAAAQAWVDKARFIPDASGQTVVAALAQLEAVDAKLRSLDAIEQTMTRPGDRQLLLLDMSHTRAEAAIAVGNVDTAQNVAVFTPGFTTTVDGSLSKYDQNMKDLRTMAEDINKRHGGGQTAAVTWIGYQAPQWDGVLDPSQSVAGPEAAKAGGEDLAKFYNGLGAGHESSGTPLHLTALGHSYGSSTTGFALGHGTPVDDAVLFGSPGQGAEHLGVPEGHLFQERNSGDDLVPNLHGTLGPSPYSSPEYHQLSTGASITELGPMNATEGHSGYLDHKSTSLYNLAAVAAGHPDMAQYKITAIAEGQR